MNYLAQVVAPDLTVTVMGVRYSLTASGACVGQRVWVYPDPASGLLRVRAHGKRGPDTSEILP
jgi:hypothetical protein